MKLIEQIGAIEFSPPEKDRIGRALLDPQSLPARVFRAKAPAIHDPEFWGHAQRKFRINGFRPGAPKAVETIINRVLAAPNAHFSKRPNSDWPLIWVPYKRCVCLHLEHELSALYELLRSEIVKPAPGSATEQILRNILRSLPLHNASVDQVRELYELWGFERFAQIEDLLANVWVDADAARRMVDDGVRTMGRKLAASLEEARNDTQRELSQHGRELTSLSASMAEMRQDWIELSTAVKTTAATSSCAQSSAGSTSVSEGAPSWPTIDRRRDEPVSEQLNTSLQDLQSRMDSLGRQLKEIRQRVERVERASAPQSEMLAARTTARSATALEVISKWRSAFAGAGVDSDSIATGWILLEIVRRARVLLTTKPVLLTSLIEATPGGQWQSVAASPLWLGAADWKDALAFISHDAGAPRLLVIEEFDVALQEAYLVPAVIAWLASSPPTVANRIVLVPSDPTLASVSPRVLEIAISLLPTSAHIRELRHVAPAIPDAIPTLELPQSGAGLLGYARTTHFSHEQQIRRYASGVGVSLPPRLVENFVNLDAGLQATLKSREALRVAREAVVMPWVELARGEAAAISLREAFEALDGH